MKTRIQQGFTLIELLVVITIIALLASLAMPVYSTVTEKGNITKGINNCKQIILALKVYASDNNGNYPDKAASGSASGGTVSDSNTAFKVLFTEGVLNDERIFGCPASPYNPDGNIGTAPTFDQALKTGENHWSMVGGLNDSATGSNPVVFENSKDTSADPTWDVKSVGKSVKGRVWSGPSIIIGLNDGSVQKMKVDATAGTLKKVGEKDQFTLNGEASGSSAATILPPLGS